MGDATATESTPSDVESKIISQIEYYFGDINLPRDKFLQEEIKKNDGWVSLETMKTFKRLQALTTDNEVIAAALRKSTNGLIEVDGEGTKIRRSKPLPDSSPEYWQQVKARTIYAKTFPDDTTLDALQEFFKEFGGVDRIVMRRFIKSKTEKNKFKGSLFVTFTNMDSAKKFVDLESVKYGDNEITRMLQEQYFQKKVDEKQTHRNKGQKGGARGERKEKVEEEKETETETVGEKDTTAADVEKPAFTEGRVIKLTGIPNERLSINDIKALFNKHSTPEWVEFERGSDHAFIRFQQQPKSAETVLEKLRENNPEGKLTLGSGEVKAEVVTGDEEKEYWERAFKGMRDARDGARGRGKDRRDGGGRGGRGGRRGGGRGRGRGRGRGGRTDNGAAAKNEDDGAHFSSSSESDAEGVAKQEFKSAKRPAPGGENGSGHAEKKVKVAEEDA